MSLLSKISLKLPFWIGNYLKFQLVPRNQKNRSCSHFFFGQPPFSKGEGVMAPFRQVMISQMLSKEKLFLDKSVQS
jgi:hypothetical protein